VLLHEVAGTFDELIGRFGCHAVASGGEMYIQPYVYLSLHLVQMRAAGWAVDFDQVAAVSGASALFAYQRDDFMPKYAHLDVEPDRRIAEATGFGYEWVSFEDVGGAWEWVIESVDAGLTGSVAGIAETGTLVLPAGPSRSQLASLLPPIHIALLPVEALYFSVGDWLSAEGRQWIDHSSCVTLISGPSRTADIEMTMTIGVHGPGTLIVVCYD